MEDKKSKRKLFKRIGAIVGAVALTIVAFSLPFLGKFDSKLNTNHLVASAQESISSVYNSNTWQIGYTRGSFSVDGVFNSGTNMSSPFNFSLLATNSGLVCTVNRLFSVSSVIDFSYSFIVTEGASGFYLPYSDTSLLESRVYITLSSSSFSVSDIIFADIFTTEANSQIWLTSIRWTDRFSNYFTFEFYTYLAGSGYVSEFIPYNARIYLPNSLSADYNTGYNQGYSEGYASGENIGYTNGYSAGENDGYSSGYKSGETIGYNNGYSKGVEVGGQYTFFSLVSAVIDAPIQAFMGLFNFELLGVNLAGFFTGLLTLAFIITIVRLVMP